MIIVSSEVFNPYPFILGIGQPHAQLFFSISEDIVASQREILVQHYREGLDAVIRLLSKAAPLTDLYFYLRDHPLQNPVKAKVHCEHGFASLRLAVKVYLDVSCYRMSPLNVFIDSPSKKCTHDLQVVPRVLRRSFSVILRQQFYANIVYIQGLQAVLSISHMWISS